MLPLMMRATRGRASKYRPRRGLNRGEEGVQLRPTRRPRRAAECAWHSCIFGVVPSMTQRTDIFKLVRQSLPRPSGRLVPVATSSVRLVGRKVTERLAGWLSAIRRPFSGPLVSGSGAIMRRAKWFVKCFVVLFCCHYICPNWAYVAHQPNPGSLP